MSHLSVQNVTMQFGGLRALHDVSFETEGEILGLIGPNGAGKTTLFNVISGFLKPTAGEVYYDGRFVHHHRPHEVVSFGLARTFQIVRPFADLTVLQNVLSGHGLSIYPRLAAFFQRYQSKRNEQFAWKILEKTNLEKWAHEPAANMPIGLQRRLEIARALATEPQLLLLDEPAAGLISQETEELARLIRQLHKEDSIHIILIEHNMNFAMKLCDRIIVLDFGQILAQGTPQKIRQNEDVINVYLGRGRKDSAGNS